MTAGFVKQVTFAEVQVGQQFELSSRCFRWEKTSKLHAVRVVALVTLSFYTLGEPSKDSFGAGFPVFIEDEESIP